jgi:hypothetical protein
VWVVEQAAKAAIRNITEEGIRIFHPALLESMSSLACLNAGILPQSDNYIKQDVG